MGAGAPTPTRVTPHRPRPATLLLQFANLVLEGTAERVIVGDQYADVPLGLHVVRGENVVLLARLDGDKEPPPGLAKVSEADIRTAQRAEREQDRVRRTMKARLDFVFDLE